jgi:hypothetical protein
MTAPRPRKPPAKLQAAAIDCRYGLEPVFEPGQGAAEDTGATPGTQFVPIQCPYCGEHFDALADLSAGSSSYIEDCQVCCQPIELALEVDDSGVLVHLEPHRAD